MKATTDLDHGIQFDRSRFRNVHCGSGLRYFSIDGLESMDGGSHKITPVVILLAPRMESAIAAESDFLTDSTSPVGPHPVLPLMKRNDPNASSTAAANRASSKVGLGPRDACVLEKIPQMRFELLTDIVSRISSLDLSLKSMTTLQQSSQ